jgi:hypothetical protein
MYPDPKRDYFVEYLDEQEIESTLDAAMTYAEKFYSKRKFKYIDKDEASNPNNKLSFCDTCNIVRPPRAFHCSYCDFCIEIHDHHCPWMGTCIGLRNLRYFIAFLFRAATLALFACLIIGYHEYSNL